MVKLRKFLDIPRELRGQRASRATHGTNLFRGAKTHFIRLSSRVVTETRVLGTSFDICSYPDMAETSIILVEGCIQATAYHRKAILHADQQLTLDTLQQKMSITDIDAKLMTQWKDGILRLDNQNFNEMLDKLSRWYGITFVNNASIDSSDRFNGKFHREDIQEAMHIISLSANITYTIKQDTIFIHPK
ncbi:MAG: FecR family protein [Butyricimonas paravirosa]